MIPHTVKFRYIHGPFVVHVLQNFFCHATHLFLLGSGGFFYSKETSPL